MVGRSSARRVTYGSTAQEYALPVDPFFLAVAGVMLCLTRWPVPGASWQRRSNRGWAMAGDCCGGGCDSDRSRDEGWERVLLIALAINSGMFAVEMIAGVTAQSASLMADAIDFLATPPITCCRRSGTALARKGGLAEGGDASCRRALGALEHALDGLCRKPPRGRGDGRDRHDGTRRKSMVRAPVVAPPRR